MAGGVIRITSLDHLVLTVSNIDVSINFYTAVLGMAAYRFGDGRNALAFGTQKINLHLLDHEFEPKALTPTPGSADLCFLVATDLDTVATHLAALGISVELGPVARSGAVGPLRSLYLRDPDGNLIELSNPQDR